MPTFIVTTINWNDPNFWSSVNGTNGDGLDFSQLTSGYTVTTDYETGEITIHDGSSQFTIGDSAAAGGPYDATMGSTLDSYEFIGSEGSNAVEGSSGAETIDGGSLEDVVYAEGGNDTINGEAGDDFLVGGTGEDTIDGGTDNDVIYGDGGTSRESLNYEYVSNTDVNNGVTITSDNGAGNGSGNVDVTFTSTLDRINLFTTNGASPYIGGIQDDGDGVDSNSVMQGSAQNSNSLGEYNWDFSAPVTNVSFNIADLDNNENVQIFAYDANGNRIEVILTPGSNVTVSDTTIDSDGADDGIGNDLDNSTLDGYDDYVDGSGSGGTSSPDQAVTVTIPGPVSRIEVYHTLDGGGNIGIQFTEMFFDVTVPGPDAAFTPPPSELLTNGGFDGNLDGWTIINPSGGTEPVYATWAGQEFIRLNSNNEGTPNDPNTFGDGISQEFGTVVGETYSTSVDLGQNGGSGGDHTVLVEILDENGNVIATETRVISNNDTATVEIDFVATTENSTIRITNPVSSATNNTDVVIFDVSVTGIDPDELLEAGGNDVIDGGAGNDEIYGDGGDDTITGGTGDDTMSGGSGSDTFVLEDGSGNDIITDYNTTVTGDGSFVDQFDVSGLTDAQGNPVNIFDVTVSSDVNGNAVLTFPNGESVTLEGVAASEIDDPAELIAAGIPCFASGTLIRTPKGEVPIEELRSGDMVMTMDNGPQPLIWVGSRNLSKDVLNAVPSLKPIHIPEGLFGNHSPLFVSPQHGMLLDETDGLPNQRLARAVHLAKAKGPVRVAHGKRGIQYHHLLFAQHQIIWANGARSESFYPGPQAMKMFSTAERRELHNIIEGLELQPVGEIYGPTAREFLKRREVKTLYDPKSNQKKAGASVSDAASVATFAAPTTEADMGLKQAG